MSLTKSILRKLEKRVFHETDYLIIPLLSTPEEAEAIRQEAKKQGKTTRGIPLANFTGKSKFVGLQRSQEVKK